MIVDEVCLFWSLPPLEFAFISTLRYARVIDYFWPHRLAVRTSGFHPENRDSTSRGAACQWIT